MPIKHLVEIGRVAYVAYGRNVGKLVVIVDVIDSKRALVEGPFSKVKRQAIRFKRLRLTPHKINIDHGAQKEAIVKAWEEKSVGDKWKASFKAKSIKAAVKRKDLSDYGRFKVYKLKQEINKRTNQKIAELKYRDVKKRKAAAKAK